MANHIGLLDGKVAVIAGATSGMGKASAFLFAEEGAKVVVVGRNAERGDATIATIKKAGGEAIFIRADTIKEEDVKQLIDKTVNAYGKIDVLYNVVGGGTYSGPLENDSVKDWHMAFDMNVVSSFLTIKYAMPHLLKSKGVIINTSSVSGVRLVLHEHYSYSCVNAALNMFTKNLAKNYASKGVRVNAIVPGVIDTPIWAQAPAELKKSLADGLPIKRMGAPEEIASVALFLASNMSSYITGQTICVDGGQSIG